MTTTAEEPSSFSSGMQPSFLDWLVANGTLSSVLAERVTRVQAETSDRLAAILLKLGLLSESELASQIAEYTGFERLDAATFPSAPLVIEGLNEEFLKTREIVPLRYTDDGLEIGCWNAIDDYVPRALKFAVGKSVALRVATRQEILGALAGLYTGAESAALDAPPSSALEDEEVDRLKDLASDAPIIRLVQRLIDDAITARASDIHIESSDRALHVRLRLDGLLRDHRTLPKSLGAPVVSRVKVMAGLDIAERRLPQDGRVRVSMQGKDIDFRVATSPTLYGESVVLRVLDRQDVALDLDALGFDDDLKTIVRDAIARPHGVVLVTGPTGSGKTTTLYAALKEINTRDRKILTVEDPVEYVLEGVNQVPVRPQIGLSFAQALRAFLRQDPDVLMVGEIRDRETAEIAIQAALTGHLLLSTLHTNTAAAAITRLLDMGVDDYLLTSTLHVILGQRLVRRLCVDCREPYAAPPDVVDRLGVAGLGASPWHRARGCAACQGTGFRGRVAILEALELTDSVRAKVLARADAHAIEQVAVAEGMRTMLRHGVERVEAGVTTIEEVLRVTSFS